MAITDAQKEQVVNDLNLAFFGLLRGIAEALTDDPATPEDESKFTISEGVGVGSRALTMGYTLAGEARGMSGEDWTRVIEHWATRAGVPF